MATIKTVPAYVDGNEHMLPIENECMLMDRTVYLTGEINTDTSTDIARQLIYLDKRSHDPITMIISSPGGEISAGKAIIDVMNCIGSKVITIAFGLVASMAAVILAAGDKGSRYACEHADIMIHQPLGGASGQASDIIITAERICREKSEMAKMIAEYTGNTVEKLLQDIDRDYWLDAHAACAYGIVDKIGFPAANESEECN